MALDATTTALNQSRLVQALAELADAGTPAGQLTFAQRLGGMIDLNKSIDLAMAQAGIREVVFEQGQLTAEQVRHDFLAGRRSIVQGVAARFASGNSFARVETPLRNGEILLDTAAAAEPYVKLYAARQRDLDFKVRQLQERTRDDVSSLSPHLARLAALDQAMERALADHHKRLLAKVPHLLGRRLHQLVLRHPPGADEAETRTQLDHVFAAMRQAMQTMLLAELDARLLTTMGLIEATDEQEQ